MFKITENTEKRELNFRHSDFKKIQNHYTILSSYICDLRVLLTIFDKVLLQFSLQLYIVESLIRDVPHIR